MGAWRLKMGAWRVYRSVVANSHHRSRIRDQIRIKVKSYIRIHIKNADQLPMEAWRLFKPVVQIPITLMRSRIPDQDPL